MTREVLNQHIQQIKDEVLLLGSMIEETTLHSIDALKQRDIEASHQIIEDDILINEKRFAIENAIIILIATQQPMAHDLRLLAAILEVDSELERMGDYAKGIAKTVIHLGDAEVAIPMREIESMAEKALNMLHLALGTFITENAAQAYQIPKLDDEVDALYVKGYRLVVSAMIANPNTIDHGNYLIWVLHNLERLADRAINICERTVFIATGELLELATNDEDDSEAEDGE
ncbi:MAG: phosphate signaling complex protein PhoU [Anaerolineaceae bacterium]|jgi:phosphate transport system protein